jgi:hypothetical protein
MNLIDLKQAVDELVANGKGDLPVYITDGHNGCSEEWSGWVTESEVNENSDGELARLDEGTPYIELSFG